MMMTEEATAKSYRGVLCGYCRQPIPLPGIVEKIAGAEAESASQETGVRSFHLRCRACEREKTYRIGDIAEFEGSPKPRSSRSHGSLFGKGPRIARAAHG
jgi:hypothetical protein